jgi:hypothetical protein
LQRTLNKELRRGGELGTVWREDELVQAAAERRTIHTFARRSEQHLFDQIANVIVSRRVRSTAAIIKTEWIIHLTHVAVTRVWVTITFNGVPVGAHTARLVCVNTGCPPASTRVAATTHCAVTHGPLPPGGTNGQPATTYGGACVVTG